MPLVADWKPYTLQFNFKARTSRGAMQYRDIFLIHIWDEESPENIAKGEAAPLVGLSPDCQVDIPRALTALCNHFNRLGFQGDREELSEFVTSIDHHLPALKFGWEMASLDYLNGCRGRYFETDFLTGSSKLPINGLIWMGPYEFMKSQVDKKLRQGFDCIKIKIGALDFEKELQLLGYIRSAFSTDIILRVDANGAFKASEAIKQLRLLEPYHLHSIEQPIAPGQVATMKTICQTGSVPVGLDEELIGRYSRLEKSSLLDEIEPQYIILKPTLLGGFSSTSEWIELAEERNIGWWITSALESNLGLSALAQFTSSIEFKGHQGLGTGQLFVNNIDSALIIKDGYLLNSLTGA